MSCASCGSWVGRPAWTASSAVFQLCDAHVYHAQCIIIAQQKNLACKVCRKYNAIRDPNYVGNDAIISRYETAVDMYLQDLKCKPPKPHLNYPLGQMQTAQMQHIANHLHFAETRPTNRLFNQILIALFVMHIGQLAMSIYDRWPVGGLYVLLIIFQAMSILSVMPRCLPCGMDIMDMRYIVAAPAIISAVLAIIAIVARDTLAIFYIIILSLTLAAIRFNKWRAYELHSHRVRPVV